MWNKESFGLVMAVQKGNFIAQDDAEILRERIAFLNQKTPTELRSLYRTRLRQPPEVNSKGASNLKIDGESYPEDVNGFYRPIMQAVDHYFTDGKKSLAVEFHLIYFNSSSARALTELLNSLEGHAANGARITVKWFCDHDDDITREFAEDITMNMEHLKITIADMTRDG